MKKVVYNVHVCWDLALCKSIASILLWFQIFDIIIYYACRKFEISSTAMNTSWLHGIYSIVASYSPTSSSDRRSKSHCADCGKSPDCSKIGTIRTSPGSWKLSSKQKFPSCSGEDDDVFNFISDPDGAPLGVRLSETDDIVLEREKGLGASPNCTVLEDPLFILFRPVEWTFEPSKEPRLEILVEMVEEVPGEVGARLSVGGLDDIL